MNLDVKIKIKKHLGSKLSPARLVTAAEVLRYRHPALLCKVCMRIGVIFIAQEALHQS